MTLLKFKNKSYSDFKKVEEKMMHKLKSIGISYSEYRLSSTKERNNLYVLIYPDDINLETFNIEIFNVSVNDFSLTRIPNSERYKTYIKEVLGCVLTKQ